MPAITLFGAGSPVIVDVEETCRRLGWPVAAIIRNVDAPDQAAQADLVRGLDGWVPAGPVAVPLFTPANRRTAVTQARALGARDFPPVVDPTSILPSRIAIGEGAYVNAGCTLGALARIGRFAFVNRGASLGHHLELGEFAASGPGGVVAGQVTIGAGAMLGAGAVVLPGVRIGAGARVAAGAVVRRDVADGALHGGREA